MAATVIHRIIGKVTSNGYSDTVWFLRSSSGYHWVYKLTDVRVINPMTAGDVIRTAWWLLDSPAYLFPQGIEMCHFILDYFGEGMCTLVALENM